MLPHDQRGAEDSDDNVQVHRQHGEDATFRFQRQETGQLVRCPQPLHVVVRVEHHELAGEQDHEVEVGDPIPFASRVRLVDAGCVQKHLRLREPCSDVQRGLEREANQCRPVWCSRMARKKSNWVVSDRKGQDTKRAENCDQQSHKHSTRKGFGEVGVVAQGHELLPSRRAPRVGEEPVDACDSARQGVGVRGAFSMSEQPAPTTQYCGETYTSHTLCQFVFAAHGVILMDI